MLRPPLDDHLYSVLGEGSPTSGADMTVETEHGVFGRDRPHVEAPLQLLAEVEQHFAVPAVDLLSHLDSFFSCRRELTPSQARPGWMSVLMAVPPLWFSNASTMRSRG